VILYAQQEEGSVDIEDFAGGGAADKPVPVDFFHGDFDVVDYGFGGVADGDDSGGVNGGVGVRVFELYGDVFEFDLQAERALAGAKGDLLQFLATLNCFDFTAEALEIYGYIGMEEGGDSVDVGDFGDVPLGIRGESGAEFGELLANGFFGWREKVEPESESEGCQEQDLDDELEVFQKWGA
jgi:hypothetical protein